MHLRTLTLLVGITALAFGQTHQKIPAAPGTVEFSANSISENDGDPRSNQLAALRRQRDDLMSTYTAQHSQVKAVQAQIDALEAGQKSSPHLVHLMGNVEIKTVTMILTANEAYFNKDTGEIEALGTVRVKPISK